MHTGQEFMEKTKYKNLPPSAQEQGATQPLLEVPYDDSSIISLPDANTLSLPPVDFLALVNERRSTRTYSEDSISREELAYLLWCTQGVQKVGRSGRATLRTVPSAGARHAFETFVLINRVESIPCGLYRYVATRHILVPHIIQDDIAANLTAACLGQGMVQTSAVTFFWWVDMQRMTYRYGERGYRYIHLDAGHVCQNLYLAAESIKCGACAIAAFDDDSLNDVLKLDGENQFSLYVCPVGKKK